MTSNRNLKRAAREYMAEHDVNYTTARRAVLTQWATRDAAPTGHPSHPDLDGSGAADETTSVGHSHTPGSASRP